MFNCDAAANCSQVPLYQSETAPKWIRGAIVGSYQWAITIGLLLAAVVNNATSHWDNSGSYRVPIALQLAWSLILFSGLLFLPETPRFLIKKNQTDKAAKALSRLRRLPADSPEIANELNEVMASHEFEMSLGQSSYLQCFKPPMLKRQLTGMGVQALQQLTGEHTCTIPCLK
jgi:MFS family permease